MIQRGRICLLGEIIQYEDKKHNELKLNLLELLPFVLMVFFHTVAIDLNRAACEACKLVE